MYLNKSIFRSQELQKSWTYEAYFFSEHCKFHVDAKKLKKMQEEGFRFLGNLL